jgi:predicted MPP superfamily phosphohydrolase
MGLSGLEPKRVLALFLFVIFALSMLLLLVGFMMLDFYRMDLLFRLGWGGVGFVSLFITFQIIRQVGGAVGNELKKMISTAADSSDDDTPDPERRRFITNCMDFGITGVSCSMVCFGTLNVLQPPEVRTIAVPIKNLHRDLEGFTIVQVGDLHVDGIFIGRKWVRTVVDKTNRLSPDVVAITGDLVDSDVPDIGYDVAPLADLRARFGCFFVTGNHEYSLGSGGAESWINEIERLGITILMNSNELICCGGARILVAGVPDYDGGYSESHVSAPETAIVNPSFSDVKILLAHQPRSIYMAEKAGFDLQLSGHTHGGQFFPGHILMALAQPFVAGLHTYRNMQIHVTRGAGHSVIPLRLGAPAEIACLKLVKA